MKICVMLVIVIIVKKIQCEPRIIGATFNDVNDVSINENKYKIYSDKKDLILFGIDIENIVDITLTHYSNNAGSDCSNIHLPINFLTKIYPNESKIVVNYIKSFIIPLNVNLYLCINTKNSNGYIHQGDRVILIIEKDHKLIPLWLSIIIISILVLLSGLFSGLNLGLMSLTPRELNLIISTGTPNERKNAKQVLPIRKKGNVLLCAILFGNTIVNSSTAILLEGVTSGVISILMSTIIIVIFGEVIPQSICARYGLLIGAKTRYFTWFVIFITFPISYPLGKLLDLIIGHETPIVYNRHQLLEVVKLNCAGNLEEDEAGIIFGALKFKSKTVFEIMTPLEECFMVEENSILNFKTISEIVKSGYSRIPVYSGKRCNIVALLHIKDLTFIDPDDMIPLISVLNFYNHPLIKVYHDTKIDVVFKEFKKGLAHLGIVVKVKYEQGMEANHESIGILTLEDIIEEIIQCEISDETDNKTSIKDMNKVEVSKNLNKHYIRQFFETFSSTIPELTPNIILTVCQFMSSTIKVFHPDLISINILRRMIGHPGVAIKRDYTEDYFLYKNGSPVDYFILIIEGRVEIIIGSENLKFIQGPFSYYGYAAFDKIDLKNIKSTEKSKNLFVPDFTLKILSNLVYIKINYSLYKIAIEATALENTRKQKGEPSDNLWEELAYPYDTNVNIQSINETTDKPDVIVITNDFTENLK